MDTLFSIIIVVSSILLVGVVFIQNPKGGGLSSDFGAAQQIGGVQKTNDFIDKTTWGLAAVVAVLSIVLTIRFSESAPEAPEEAPTEEAPVN
ncbi:MAG: preprotein translocase subunit SecG [Crocinitomicaceae bacterium]|nr:preprotein translocase subunit SecG [Crocinitomicaceae bacterium]